MKKSLLMILLLTFVLACLSSAEIVQCKKLLGSVSRSSSKDKASGQPLWQNKMWMKKIKHEGRDFFYVREEGSGIYGKDKKYKTWLAESYFLKKGLQLVPYQASLVYKNRDGKVVRSVSKVYDAENKEVICQVDGKEKKFTFEEDLVDVALLGTIIQNYPYDTKADLTFRFLSVEPSVYKVTLKHRGIETVSLEGESIKCHKLEMIPDLGALSIFGAFVPKTYFWYTVAEPHSFVKYEGLESGLGTPYIVMERRSL